MPAQFGMQNDVSRRNHVSERGVHDHLIRTTEVRRRHVEAIAQRVHRVWTKTRRALERLMNGRPREQTPATDGKQISKPLGRASVAEALRRDLVHVTRLVGRFILEPYARGRRRRIAIAQLRTLDDHLLADIGLTRGQIEQAVDGMLSRRGEPFLRPVERGVPAEEARDELRMAA